MVSDNVKNEFKSLVLKKLISKSFNDIQIQNCMYLIGVSIEFSDYFIDDKDKIILLFDLYLDIIDNLILNDKNINKLID